MGYINRDSSYSSRITSINNKNKLLIEITNFLK